MYLINRYYDPSLRQFISVDPAYSQTHQLYGYANENPVNGSDPSGLWFASRLDDEGYRILYRRINRRELSKPRLAQRGPFYRSTAA